MCQSRSSVVYWSGDPSSVRTVCGSNPAGNPPLTAKAVDRQPCPMIVLRGQNRWVSCADGIKLQSLRSVRFWTSLVRNCLKLPEQQNSVTAHWRLTQVPRSDPVLTVQSRQLQTNKQVCVKEFHTLEHFEQWYIFTLISRVLSSTIILFSFPAKMASKQIFM